MKNARTKHLDFIIGDMVALGLAQFLMVLLNQDKLNPVLYVYYVQLVCFWSSSRYQLHS